MVRIVFGLDFLLGTAIGTTVLTVEFRRFFGAADGTPSAADPSSLGHARNATYAVWGGALTIVAFLSSFYAEAHPGRSPLMSLLPSLALVWPSRKANVSAEA